MYGNFWERPLNDLDQEEWEALCDSCGLCCLHKVEDEDTGIVYLTKLACKLLDLNQCSCSNYATRHKYVTDCIKLNIDDLAVINWLPKSCAYVRRFNGLDLPEWHYLISKDKELVHKLGISLQGKMLPEQLYDPKKQSLQDFIVEHPSYANPPK
ncbi:hypothetical protein AwWohl_07340 [Gammaproteobacteria bacterium]|nr:hypothetical protein AwWohl_07340 [Gammaproteobacteria bacterium]